MSDIIKTLKEVSDKMAIALKLKETPTAEIKFGEVMMMGGNIIFEYEGEILEPGVNVFAIDKAAPDVKIPVPVGKYPLEDGTTLVVNQEGVVAEIMPAEMEEEEPAPAPAPAPMEAKDEQSVVNDIKSILIKYQEDSNKRFEAIEKTLSEMKQEVVEMAEQPREKPRAQMAPVKLDKKGRILETIRNIG